MIHFIFTLDYEIYGNGKGSLKELIIQPTDKILKIFSKYNDKLVIFAECAEFIKIKEYNTDPDIEKLNDQLYQAYLMQHEIGLHLHPQWINSIYTEQNWKLDFTKVNIAKLTESERDNLIYESIFYLKEVLMDKNYNPSSFRSGLWLMQPTSPIYESLKKYNIKIDSSLFREGYHHNNGLDFRSSLHNKKVFWPFISDINLYDESGLVIEIPIYSEMVWFFRLLTKNRIKSTGKRPSFESKKSIKAKLVDKMDFFRLKYPKKFDFTKLTFEELCQMTISINNKYGNINDHIPIVLIGHSKNSFNPETIDKFLAYLNNFSNINICTFKDFFNLTSTREKFGTINTGIKIR